MKALLFSLILVVSISSCSTSGKIISVEDPYKNTSSLKLHQVLSGYADGNKGGTNGRVNYLISADYIFEESKDAKPELSMNLQLVTGIKAAPLDSLVFLNINFEKFKLIAHKSEQKEFVESSSTSSTYVIPTTTKKTTTGTAPIIQTSNTVNNSTNQLMSTTVSIPVNLWEPLAYTNVLFYRIYLGKEGIDVKVDGKDLAKLKSMMQMAVDRNKKANVLPEGLKKW